MDDDTEEECDDDAHYFDSDDDGFVPSWRECLCGEHTWGEMDELLILTRMLRMTTE